MSRKKSEPEAVTALRQAYWKYWTTPRKAKGWIWLDMYKELGEKAEAVGEKEARRILQEEGERFHAEVGYCPSCGQAAGPYHSFRTENKCNRHWGHGDLLEGDESDEYCEIAGNLQCDDGYSYDESGRIAYEAIVRSRKGSKRRRPSQVFTEGW